MGAPFEGFHPTGRTLVLLGTALAAIAMVGCAATQVPPDQMAPVTDPPGFLLGLWHGFIAPITFFISLFSEEIRIYAVPNSGRWYDLGFMLGISGFSGGVFAGSRTKRS
jgi:hypothetical protein